MKLIYAMHSIGEEKLDHLEICVFFPSVSWKE